MANLPKISEIFFQRRRRLGGGPVENAAEPSLKARSEMHFLETDQQHLRRSGIFRTFAMPRRARPHDMRPGAIADLATRAISTGIDDRVLPIPRNSRCRPGLETCRRAPPSVDAVRRLTAQGSGAIQSGLSRGISTSSCAPSPAVSWKLLEVSREEDISAPSQEPQADPRVSQAHEDPRRARGPAAAPPQGAQAADRQRRQEVAPVTERSREAPSRAAFPRCARVRKRTDYLRIQTEGRRLSSPHYLLFALRGGDASARRTARIGVTVSKK